MTDAVVGRVMKCLKCRKELDEKGKCVCGFSLFSDRVLLTTPLSYTSIGNIQALYARQNTSSIAELKKLSSTQLFELASKIIEKKDETTNYAQAVTCYRLAAEKNHADAQFCLGMCYEKGLLGVGTNHAEAMKWYKLAAQQNVPEAQYRLGLLYRNGWECERNDEEAIKWFERAAYAGIVEAQFFLGWIYRNASGADKDIEKAMKWMRLAAEQGNKEAARTYHYMQRYDGRA